MDWSAFILSLKLAAWTTALLLPLGVVAGRALAARRFTGKAWIEAGVALPLVLPPTVLGYYLLVAFGSESALGVAWQAVAGRPLVFTFEGLLLASMVFNIPFVIQPVQRAFEALPPDMREAAWVSGMSRSATFWKIELPLAWPGILTALVLTFAHTMGEFGVVLMVGGNIPDETKTIAIAIYDRVQAFDDARAGAMSALLLFFAFAAIGLVYAVGSRFGRSHG